MIDPRPDRLERWLGALALALLGLVLIALLRGAGQWHAVPAVIWVHLVAMVVVLALTPALLWQRRGTARHRVLGWTWAAGMMISAADSLLVRTLNPGHFSPIHVLSVVVLLSVPFALFAARRHDLARHRRTIRGLVIGALLIAGFFTFPFGRMLGRWLLQG